MDDHVFSQDCLHGLGFPEEQKVHQNKFDKTLQAYRKEDKSNEKCHENQEED